MIFVSLVAGWSTLHDWIGRARLWFCSFSSGGRLGLWLADDGCGSFEMIQLIQLSCIIFYVPVGFYFNPRLLCLTDDDDGDDAC